MERNEIDKLAKRIEEQFDQMEQTEENLALTLKGIFDYVLVLDKDEDLNRKFQELRKENERLGQTIKQCREKLKHTATLKPEEAMSIIEGCVEIQEKGVPTLHRIGTELVEFWKARGLLKD